MKISRITTYSLPTSGTQNPQIRQNPELGDPFAGFAGFAERLPFPTHSFPDWLARYIRAVSKARMVPESMAGAAALGIASAACGAGLRVENQLGELPANLFLICAAETGTGKDLTLGPIAEPLREIERELETAFHNTLVPTLSAKRHAIEQRQKRRGTEAPTNAEVEAMTIELAEINRQLRAIPQLIVNDCTAQALAEVMAAQPGEAVASITSEGRGPLSIILGKFSSRRGSSDEDFFAGAFSGTPRTVNRKGKGPTSEAYRLNRPCLSLLWFIQPDAYRAALAEPAMIHSGFLCRPLSFDSFAEPPIVPEDLPTIPENLVVAWRSLVRQLAQTYRANGDEPQKVRLDPEAGRILREFSNETSRARSSNGPLRDVAGIAARWAENAYRVSLVLHATEFGSRAHERAISAATAQASINLVRWFAAETLALLAETRQAKRENRETRLIEILTKAGGEQTLRNLRDTNGFSEAEIEGITKRTGKIAVLEISQGIGRPSRIARLLPHHNR